MGQCELALLERFRMTRHRWSGACQAAEEAGGAGM
jgi:hypothetical protein